MFLVNKKQSLQEKLLTVTKSSDESNETLALDNEGEGKVIKIVLNGLRL